LQTDTEQSSGHKLLPRLTVYAWYKTFKEAPYLCRHPARHVRREGGMTCDTIVVGPKKSKKVYIHSAGPALQHRLADPKKKLRHRGFTPSGTKQR